MSLILRIRGLLQLLLRRGELEQELNDEVGEYFATLVDRQVRRGVPLEEARRLVRLHFEGSEQVKEKVREARTGAGIISVVRDLKYALRTLRKNRTFAAVTILTLALGIGATTAIFSVVYAVLLKPLPYHDANRLVLLFQTSREDSRQPFLLSDLQTLRSQNRNFSDIAIYYKDTGFSRVTLSGASEPQSAQGGYVSNNFFPLLGIAPSVGRVFTADEELRGERVVLLSHKLCIQRFGSVANAIGKTAEIDGARFQIIGVMPPNFEFPARDVEFWAPITTNRYWFDQPARGTNGRGFYARWNALARLKHGASVGQAQTELSVLAPQLDQRDPELNRGLGLTAVPLRVEVSGNTRLALSILLAAVSILLLIACVNAAHLMLAHGANREQEIAVRLSLGARRGDVLRQLLTESVVMSLSAGCCGVALAVAGLRALLAFAPGNVPRLEQATVSSEILCFALGVSFTGAILSGFLPAWKFSRTTPNDALKVGGRSSSATAGLGRIRAFLVMAEFALTVVLLSGAGLLIRSFLAVEAVDPGFNPEHVLMARVTLPSGTQHRFFYEDALARIAAIPGVRAVGAISGLFEEGATYGGAAASGDTQQMLDGRLRVWANWKSIRGEYFQAMGITLLRGRFFNQQDNANAPLVAIIDESMARRYWPGENAVGKQFRGHDPRGRDDDPLTVVGIVHNTHTRGREVEPIPHVFQPVAQLNARDNPATPDLVIRTTGDPTQLAITVRDVLRSVDHTAIISMIATIEEHLDEQVSPRRFQTWLLTVFSLLALVLASIGIYGVMHYSVAQRTRELGIRMALGAEPDKIWRMILEEGLKMMVPGLIAGLLGAHWLTTLLSGVLFGVKTTDPLTYLSVVLVLTSVAIVAIWIPARRAATVDPLHALHQE
jgi:predicted permease